MLVTLSHAAMLAGQADAGVLGTGEVLPPGQLRRMRCDAAVLPVVLGGRSQPLDLGRAARLSTLGPKRAMLARDGGCFGLGCDPHPERTEAHHFVEWSSGGRTDIDTGGLVREFWHRKIHAEGRTRGSAATATPSSYLPTGAIPTGGHGRTTASAPACSPGRRSRPCDATGRGRRCPVEGR